MARISYTEGYSDKSVLKQLYDIKKDKQDKLVAGANIIIEGNVISATGEGGAGIWGQIIGDIGNQRDLMLELSGKQDRLVSGVSIKTVNEQSLLGAGNIEVQGGGGFQITAEDGYYTLADGGDVTLTDRNTYWELSWERWKCLR